MLAELHRVLRPGGALVGCGSLDLEEVPAARAGDAFVPVDPAGLPRGLGSAGFCAASVEVADHQLRFRAVEP